MILVLLSFTAKGQSFRIEDFKKNFSKEEWFKASGSISLQGTYYTAKPSYGHDPWNYYLNGNVNFNLFNLINLPLSVSLTNSGMHYAYPNLPNRFSIHPSYKWITVHAGDISMSYSPYTLGGHQFTGGGIDLTPDNWNISFMCGRMQKPVEFDSTNTYTTVLAAYRRWGIGGKVRYDHKFFYLGANMFLAKDNENSLDWKPDSLGIKPQKNLTSGFEAGFTLFKSLQLSGEYAFSFLKMDIRNEDKMNFYQAFKVAADYSIKTHTIGVSYERVDPFYKSLGAYYFENDIEKILLNYSGSVAKQKLSYNLSLGLQRNDLKKTSSDKRTYFAGSFNINANPIENWRLSAGYSNMRNYQRVKSQFDYINEFNISENADTLTCAQVSHQANFSTSYTIKEGESRTHAINLSGTYHLMDVNQLAVEDKKSISSMINASLGYSLQFLPQSVGLDISVNYTDTKQTDNQIDYVGPTLGIRASFLEKTLNLSASLSTNAGFTNSVYNQLISNARISLSYTLKKKHCFAFSTLGQYKYYKEKKNSFLYNASLTYTFSF